MHESANNPFAPPRALVSDEAGAADDGPQLATRGQRFGAALIDSLFAFALSAAVMLPMYGTGYFQMLAKDKMQVIGGLVIYLAIFYAVEGWFLHRRRQSLGKMAMGLRIVAADGSRASFGRVFGARLLVFGALGRIPVVGILISIVDALFIFGRSHRCLHDLVADTIVVTAASAPLPAPAAA